LGAAARQYAAAGEVTEYVKLLRRWAKEGYTSERDLFFARAALHMLSIGR
jgi:hypothetical protein